MSNAPIDFNIRRRAVLQARVDRARRRLADAEVDARDNAAEMATFREQARLVYVSPADVQDANAFADRIERDAAAALAFAAEQLQTEQAELARLTNPDDEHPC